MKGKIVLLIGLQGSGKSTLAKKLKEENPSIVIVSKDAIRASKFPGEPWNKEQEELVREYWMSAITAAFKAGKTVIVDDAGNFSFKIQALLAAKFGSIEPNCECCRVSLQECIRRDSLRKRSVGAEVIKNYAEKNKDFLEAFLANER